MSRRISKDFLSSIISHTIEKRNLNNNITTHICYYTHPLNNSDVNKALFFMYDSLVT